MPKRKTADETGPERAVVTVPLTASANHAINNWCDSTGASKTKLVGRLIEWFSRAPGSVQQMIVGSVPADMRDDYAKRAAAFFQGIAAGDAAAGVLVDIQPKEGEAGAGGVALLSPDHPSSGRSGAGERRRSR